MPLIEIVGADPVMKKIKLKRRFADLPELDKQGVVDFMEAGRTGQGAEGIDLSPVGRDFIKHPDFIEMFNQQTQPAPAAPDPQQTMMAPIIQGLMQIIQQTRRPRPHPEGMLRPEHQERVGGSQRQQGGGFEQRLGSAFSQGGVRGLASAHRDMFASDSGYKRFLKGEK